MVASGLQNRSKCDYFVIQHALIVVISHLFYWKCLWDIWHSVPMTIDSSKQHGSRRGTATGGMVICERNAFRRQFGYVGGADFTAKRRDICITKVICEYKYNIRFVSRLSL